MAIVLDADMNIYENMDSYEESDCVPKTNRLRFCPGCLGKLSGDKDPHTDSKGTCYRERHCLRCGAVFETRQPRECIVAKHMGPPPAELQVARASFAAFARPYDSSTRA